jgi:hypothetical protein
MENRMARQHTILGVALPARSSGDLVVWVYPGLSYLGPSNGFCPGGTGFPATSCPATLMLSLRDKIHLTAEALLKSALMGKEGCSSFATG